MSHQSISMCIQMNTTKAIVLSFPHIAMVVKEFPLDGTGIDGRGEGRGKRGRQGVLGEQQPTQQQHLIKPRDVKREHGREGGWLLWRARGTTPNQDSRCIIKSPHHIDWQGLDKGGGSIFLGEQMDSTVKPNQGSRCATHCNHCYIGKGKGVLRGNRGTRGTGPLNSNN